MIWIWLYLENKEPRQFCTLSAMELFIPIIHVVTHFQVTQYISEVLISPSFLQIKKSILGEAKPLAHVHRTHKPYFKKKFF